jgi:hypothetical protein
MCKAFSCLVTKSKKVYWKAGVDSHSALNDLFLKKDSELKDDKDPPYNTFASVEISPQNKNYLKPNKWVFKVDMERTPEWFSPAHEVLAWEEFKKWKKEVYSHLDLKKLLKPIHPFKIKPPKITKKHLKILLHWSSVWDSVGGSVRDSVGASVWASVRSSVWDSVRDSVRDSVGASVGAFVGSSVWDSVGASVWASVRSSVWDSVRDSVRDSVGASVGAFVGSSVWDSVGGFVGSSVWDSVGGSVWDSVGGFVVAYIGSNFKNIKKWKYIKFKNKGYPFNDAVKLWKMGIVATYNGKIWRLHGGKTKILYENTVEGLKQDIKYGYYYKRLQNMRAGI